MRDFHSSTDGVAVDIAKGWRPNAYLTNMSMAYFADPADFVATSIFPICPVQQSSSYYYTFSKADLARDNVKPKPAFGKVAPAVMGQSDDTYKCKVNQILVGIDSIAALDYQRARAPGVADPRRAKVRFANEQMLMHLDLMFAEKFFRSGVWANELHGTASGSGSGEFIKFTDANFDPVGFFDDQSAEMKRKSRRRPNRLTLGVEAFNALKKHPDVLERVKYTGTTANPARVTADVLAQLLGFQTVKVVDGSYNAGGLGKEDMRFIMNANAALISYAPDQPAIDEPSAGYIYTWDMLGNGAYTAFDQFEGEKGTHAEFIEGLMATDMKVTSDDMAVFLTDCV